MKIRPCKSVFGILASILCCLTVPWSSAATETVVVGYSQGRPSPLHLAKARGWLDEIDGMKVEFRSFEHPADMANAAVSGSLQLIASLDSGSFAYAASLGVPYVLVGVAAESSPKDACAVRAGADLESPRDLAGKRVGVPWGSESHYRFLQILERSPVDPADVRILDMAPGEMAAALDREELDAGCAREPFPSAMLEVGGNLLVSADEEEKREPKAFDAIVAGKRFAAERPEALTRILQIMDRSIRHYRENPDESHRLVSQATGLSPEKTAAIMSDMEFFTRGEQRDPSRLGSSSQPGGILDHIETVARFFHEEKVLDQLLDDYSSTVDPSFYEAVK